MLLFLKGAGRRRRCLGKKGKHKRSHFDRVHDRSCDHRHSGGDRLFHGENTRSKTVHATESKPASALPISYDSDAACGMR